MGRELYYIIVDGEVIRQGNLKAMQAELKALKEKEHYKDLKANHGIEPYIKPSSLYYFDLLNGD